MWIITNGKGDKLKRGVERVDYDPYIVGMIAGLRVRLVMDDDGWNAQGTLKYSPETGGVEPCTGSCRPYQNLIGYSPQPNPRTNPDLSTDENKYNCTGLCRHWQPLQEGSPAGSLMRQEFVVPHIGQTGRTFVRSVTAMLDDPEYDLYEESLAVIEQLKMTSSDPIKKKKVEFHNDKLNVRSMIRHTMTTQFAEIPIQDYYLFTFMLGFTEMDALTQAWHEKVIHDYVRPTTYIKHWDSDMLETFGGDIDHDGPVEIKARDFEALIRVMPHGEFPSGSSCLCTTYMEYVDEYTTRFHGRKSVNITYQFGGQLLFWENMTVVRDECSESRLWGGMHFREAIPAGQKICSGIGKLGVDYVEKMKDNSIEYAGELFYRDSPRPKCGSR